MKLPKELTRVTPLSKTLALFLFVTLPIVTYLMGMSYRLTLKSNQQIIATPAPTVEAVGCTMDAKICPDGTAVGRIPPNCEFAPCPDQTREEYQCPENNWVDCMPGPDRLKKTQCSPQYLQWAQENCPGFKGAAY